MLHMTSLSAALLAALAAPAVSAATSPGAVPHIDDLLRVDALGYECIADADLERAFQATGKPFHLPRTCLPAPCARQLSRDDLARVLGREPDQPLWDDYVARYAQTCVHEALWPGESGTGAPAAPADTAGFWAPIRGAGGAAEGPGAAARSPVAVALASAAPRIDLSDDRPHRPGDDAPPAPPPAPEVSPVPLPPASTLLLAGLLGLGLARRRA